MADSSVAITAGSGTPIRVLTGLGSGSADQQVVTIADSAGNLLGTASLPFITQPVGDPDTVASGTLSATDAVVAAPAGDGVLLSGTPTANSSLVVVCPGGDSSWDLQLTGTFGGGTVYFEGSFDGGVSYLPLNGRQTGIVNTVLGFSTTTAGMYRGNTSGTSHIRVRIKGATTPSVAATIRLSSGVGAVFLNASIPAGTNQIGKVQLSDGSSALANVKSANTAADAGSAALVVTLSPNSPAYPVASQASTTLGAVATAVTLTLTAPGAGLRHYITGIWFERYVSVATTAAASAFVSTAGNHGMVFQLPSDAQPIGTVNFPVALNLQSPLQTTTQNTAATFGAPAVAGTQYRISVTYYIAP